MSNQIQLNRALAATVAATAAALLAVPAQAKDEQPVLVTCSESLGSVALVDGDTAGWNEYGLGSPRALINALAVESGCFTPHNTASGAPARFLITAIAGSQEEVDRGIEMAKAGAAEALVRSGAAARVLGNVPMGGALLGAFGGLGGKRKTYAAGLRVVSPANGMTVAAGSGTVRKASLTFGGNSWAGNAASASGYNSSKDGQALAEAFILAFNQLVAQRDALAQAPQVAAAAAPVTPGAITAVATTMRASPAASAAEVRALRAGTALVTTGKRDGLFVEVADSFGTTGWVSVEDLQ